MSVFVAVEDREGETLVNAFEIDKIYRRFPRDSGVCLRFAGETEDASFNAMQSPALVAELEGIASAVLDEVERKELERLLSVCRKHSGKRHEHIRFYGEGDRE